MGQKRGIRVTSFTMPMSSMTKITRGMPLTSTAEQQRRVSPGLLLGGFIPMNWRWGAQGQHQSHPILSAGALGAYPGKVNPANRLGMCYFDGRGVERDYAKAFQLLKWAEDHGGPAMLYYLGACYANGQGTQQDYAKAFTYLEKVNWDCPHAFIFLEDVLQRPGCSREHCKGCEYLQKAGDM